MFSFMRVAVVLVSLHSNKALSKTVEGYLFTLCEDVSVLTHLTKALDWFNKEQWSRARQARVSRTSE